MKLGFLVISTKNNKGKTVFLSFYQSSGMVYWSTNYSDAFMFEKYDDAFETSKRVVSCFLKKSGEFYVDGLGENQVKIHELTLIETTDIPLTIGTSEFYNENADDLIKKYDQADMTHLYNFATKYVKPGDSFLDIGFGSGRDLDFFKNYGCNIYGVDSNQKFVINARNRFKPLESFRFKHLDFCNIDLMFGQNHLDVIYSVATWMHLLKTEQKEAVKEMHYVLKPGGYIVLSFSLNGNGRNDGRYFDNLTKEGVIDMFNTEGFSVVEIDEAKDSLGRDDVEWVTIVFQK